MQKSAFALAFLGLKPFGISPFLQTFIYKTYCLSTFTFGLETTTLNKETRDYLNTCQNNLLRQIIGLKKFCHMSRILKCLKLFNFEELYLSSKLSFLSAIHFNQLSYDIFQSLLREKDQVSKTSKSFKKDILLLENHFNSKIEDIAKRPYSIRLEMKKQFNLEDGLKDSIMTCLINYKSHFYRNLLNDLIYKQFYI